MTDEEKITATCAIDVVASFYGPQYTAGLDQCLNGTRARFMKELQRRLSVPSPAPRLAAIRTWRKAKSDAALRLAPSLG